MRPSFLIFRKLLLHYFMHIYAITIDNIQYLCIIIVGVVNLFFKCSEKTASYHRHIVAKLRL